MDQFSQPGYPETVVPGQEHLGRSLVGGLPRTDLHRINVTAMEKRHDSPAASRGLSLQAAAARQPLPTRHDSIVSAETWRTDNARSAADERVQG